jgi:uncharacterized membrane protein
VFGLAFLFRIQAWVLGWSSPRALLKVDILNIMGPAIVAAAVLWRLIHANARKAAAFVVVGVAVAMLTPPVRAAHAFALLPDALEAYIRPVPTLTNFTLFPWAAFVFMGAAVGTLIDAARTSAQEARVNAALGVAGAIACAGGYAASFLPPLYANSDFWTSSPAFFAMRSGIVSMAIALTYAYERRWGSEHMAWLATLGRSSLFVYWIHVEMVYGLLARPIRHQLALPVMFAASALFTFMLYVIVRIKNYVMERRRAEVDLPRDVELRA